MVWVELASTVSCLHGVGTSHGPGQFWCHRTMLQWLIHGADAFPEQGQSQPFYELEIKAVDLGFQSLLVEEKSMRPNVKDNWRQIEFGDERGDGGERTRKGMYLDLDVPDVLSFFRMLNYISKLILSLVEVTAICFFAIYNQGVHWRTQIWCVIKHYVLSERKRSLSFILLSSWWKHLRVLHKYSLNTKLRAHGFREMPQIGSCPTTELPSSHSFWSLRKPLVLRIAPLLFFLNSILNLHILHFNLVFLAWSSLAPCPNIISFHVLQMNHIYFSELNNYNYSLHRFFFPFLLTSPLEFSLLKTHVVGFRDTSTYPSLI